MTAIQVGDEATVAASSDVRDARPTFVIDSTRGFTRKRESTAGIVAGMSAAHLADAISELAGDEGARLVMGRIPLDLARSSFSWSATASSLMTLYQRLAAN